MNYQMTNDGGAIGQNHGINWVKKHLAQRLLSFPIGVMMGRILMGKEVSL